MWGEGMDWIIVALLALLLWRVAALRSETRRLFLSLAGGIDRLEERLSDAEHGIDQARTAANDTRDAITADPTRKGK